MRSRARIAGTSTLTVAQRQQVEAWWNRLDSGERRSLRRRHASRRLVVVGRFVEDTADAEPNDYYEYLVNHELYLTDGRQFFICSAHAAARQVVEQGLVPASFRCPRGHVGCPMRKLLAQADGRGLLLSVQPLSGGAA